MLKRAFLNLAILFACLLSSAQSSLATTVVLPPDDDLIIGARLIVIGKVISVASGIDPRNDRIYTYVTLRVQEVLKGEITERKIVLKEVGGDMGDRGFTTFGNPRFSLDERVLVYLDTWADGSLRVYQMFLGKFSIVKDPVTKQSMALRGAVDSDTLILNGAAADRALPGSITDRMELASYKALVRSRLAVNVEQSRQFEASYYAGAPALAEPPELTAALAQGELRPQYRLLTSRTPVRWFEIDGGQPVQFYVNPEGAPYPETVDDMHAVMNVWSAIPGCALRVSNAGQLSDCYSGTGKNAIIFNNCDGRNAPTPGCSGIIAWGGAGWGDGSTKVINGTTFYRASEGFVSFNPYASCFFTSRCNVQEIATHELGHAVGLGHSEFSDATMSGSAHFDNRCASLRQDDMNGATFIYPVANGGDGALTIVTSLPMLAGKVGIAYSQTLIGSGGATPYSWRLASGALPTGLALNSSGAISGTPSSTGAFDFTVKLTDAQGATAEKALSIVVGEPSTGFDSKFVAQNVPATLQPGQEFFAHLRWLNTGVAAWGGDAGVTVRSQSPANNSTWGGNIFPIFDAVPAGQEFSLLASAFAPRTPGTYVFQWQLHREGTGFFGQMSAGITVTVSSGNSPNPPAIGGPPALEGMVGLPFSHQLSATGGLAPYTWSIVSGALPAGLNLNRATGLVSGVPTLAIGSTVTVQVTDAESRTAQKALALTIAPAPLDILTAALPATVKGSAYNHQLAATGGVPPYAWQVSAGAMPPGLSLNAATGTISGTAAAAGTFTLTVEVSDAGRRTAGRTFSMTIKPTALSIETGASTEAATGTAFSYTFGVAGGAPPYTFSIASGTLPAGLTLTPSTGAILGTPAASGSFSVVIEVRDQASQSARGNLAIKVIDSMTIPVITGVSYKASKKKLTVRAIRVDQSATLLIDNLALPVRFNNGEFLMKKLVLTPGAHDIRVINSNRVSSQPFILNVK